MKYHDDCIRIYVNSNLAYGFDSKQLFFMKGENQIIKEIIWEERNNAICQNPDINLGDTEAQALMDDLWRCGIRPREGKGSAGSLKATENHLEDMRKIVFNKLKITDGG